MICYKPSSHDTLRDFEPLRHNEASTAGEWYYTTDFGGPETRDYDNSNNIDGLTPAIWQARRDVLAALLGSMPSSMLVHAIVVVGRDLLL